MNLSSGTSKGPMSCLLCRKKRKLLKASKKGQRLSKQMHLLARIFRSLVLLHLEPEERFNFVFWKKNKGYFYYENWAKNSLSNHVLPSTMISHFFKSNSFKTWEKIIYQITSFVKLWHHLDFPHFFSLGPSI